MAAVLLDTHTMIWFVSSQQLGRSATIQIGRAREERSLFISPISAWEVGTAALKKNPAYRPNLLGLTPDAWFLFAAKFLSARIAPISRQVAIQAATVPAIYGAADPGDCFLIATARVRNLTLVTRDARMLTLAGRNPTYLTALAC